MNTRIIGVACVLALGFGARDAAAQVYAQVYKCRDKNGNVTYVDRPCPETEKTEETPPIDGPPTEYPDEAQPRPRSGQRSNSRNRPRGVCEALSDPSTSDEDVINCARSKSLPYGRTWAMTTPWRDSGDGASSAQGYCLGGKKYMTRTSLYFVDDFRYLKYGKERFYVNGLFAGAVDDGAVKACEAAANARR